MRILLVDDEDLTRHILRRYLASWGHEVVEAKDGAAAWTLFEAKPLPMVITDWMMPGIDGLELIRRIRAHPHGAQVWAVLVTGRTSKEDVVSGMDAGADDFLPKPFDKDELRVRIREGERIVGLEQALAQAAAQCATFSTRVQRLMDDAQREVEQAADSLQPIQAQCQGALEHLDSARKLMAALRQEAVPAPGADGLGQG